MLLQHRKNVSKNFLNAYFHGKYSSLLAHPLILKREIQLLSFRKISEILSYPNSVQVFLLLFFIFRKRVFSHLFCSWKFFHTWNCTFMRWQNPQSQFVSWVEAFVRLPKPICCWAWELAWWVLYCEVCSNDHSDLSFVENSAISTPVELFYTFSAPLLQPRVHNPGLFSKPAGWGKRCSFY